MSHDWPTVYEGLIKHWPNDGGWKRTYRLSRAVIDRLDVVSAQYQVGVSDLVNYLLMNALEQVERGNLEIPTRAPGLRRIDYDGR